MIGWGKGSSEDTAMVTPRFSFFFFFLLKVFHIMEEAKTLFNLVDYFISQITLEQIFLTFANIDKAKK